MIKIENGKEIDLILCNVLYIPKLHSNLISILKICSLELKVHFRIKNVIINFNNERTAI